MTHHSVTGKQSSCELKGEVKRSRPQGFSFNNSLKRITLFAFTLPILLLIGGRWLANVSDGSLLNIIPDLIPHAYLPDIANLQNVLNLPMEIKPSNHYTLAIVPVDNKPIERYDLLEFDIQTTIPTNNPYDPKDIELKVQLTTPTGRKVDVGAFWYQDFDPQTRQPQG